MLLARGLVTGLIGAAGSAALQRHNVNQINADFNHYHGDEVAYLPMMPTEGAGRRKPRKRRL